nr:VasL domain-containing protein [Pantoea stewartii]
MVWKHPDIAGIEDGSQQQIYWLIAGGCISGCALIVSVVLVAAVRNAGKQEFNKLVDNTNGDDEKKKRENDKAPVHPAVVMCNKIRGHLRSRIGLYWRRKTRLLLITGDEAAIELLVPGLQENQWLEGNRTVLIYGGSLTAEPDKEKYAALRKLRRGRPLDGIVRVMPQSLNLTPQISDNDLRGLEKISELLRYSAPVWLWQLCDSTWSQAKRTEQPVGASFPLRAKPDDITRQLELMLPALRTQGVSQVAENNGHDFLLRLGQHLKDGGIARWAQQLEPWLAASQQRVPLRGLMFSLPENKPAATAGETASAAPADAEKYIPESQRHALTLPVTWQGIVDARPEYQANVEVLATLPAPVKKWKSFVAGMGAMLAISVAAVGSWQYVNRPNPLQAQLAASLAPLPATLTPEQVDLLRQQTALPQNVIARTQQQLNRLDKLPPGWSIDYSRQLVEQAQALWPEQAKSLAQQWQQQRSAAALPAEQLNGWSQGMMTLQKLSDRLNGLDEQKGKYITVSELKSVVFATMQFFNQSIPAEEQLRLLSQHPAGKPLPAAAQSQLEMHLKQLTARYAELKQQAEK